MADVACSPSLASMLGFPACPPSLASQLGACLLAALKVVKRRLQIHHDSFFQCNLHLVDKCFFINSSILVQYLAPAHMRDHNQKFRQCSMFHKSIRINMVFFSMLS